MKMQEVIAKLREEAPILDKSAKAADRAFEKARALFDDFRRAESDEGRMLLIDAVAETLNGFAEEYATARRAIERLCMVNAAYKERLGPKKAKPKDIPGQQMLPGMEDVK